VTENLPTVNVNWDAELRGAAMLVKSGMTPKDINRPEAAMFIILAGRDMGLSAVQSLRSLRVIHGKVELSADVQLGLFHRAGGKSQWLELTDQSVRLKLVAPWSIEAHVCTYTVEDARRAKLAGGESWQKYPKAMLRSRAITSGLKDIGFIPTSGVYAPGEISEGEVIIDQHTGEVLPGEVTIAEKVAAVDIGGDLAAHVVKELPADTYAGVKLTAGLIANAIKAANTTGALNVYLNIDDAEEKIAVKAELKAMLDKAELKTFRSAYDDYCKEQIKNMPIDPNDGGLVESERYHEHRRAQEPVVLGAEPDIKDVRALIKQGDLDTAADVASSLTDPILRKTAEEEVLRASAHKAKSIA